MIRWSRNPGSSHEPSLYGSLIFRSQNKEKQSLETLLQDSLFKLNTGETADFIKAFSMIGSNSMQKRLAEQKRMESPPTLGRPIFNFSAGNLSRKSFPSKWDDAEKWVLSSSSNVSPTHATKPSDASKASKLNIFADKKVSSSFAREPNSALHEASSEMLLKDLFRLLRAFLVHDLVDQLPTVNGGSVDTSMVALLKEIFWGELFGG
ncbi:hypothetical protein ACLOJK_004947 [Asimina triloba]